VSSLGADLALGAVAIAIAMAFLWVLERVRRDATHVDVAWSFAIGALAVFYAARSDVPASSRMLVTTLAVLWSLRLGCHLLFTRVLGRKEEDGRYRDLRARWGARAGSYFFVFFQAQALLAWVFSLPILAALRNPERPLALEIVAVAIWTLAIVGETLADHQLARFRARPESAGRTCRDGLWRYSRHPNYFFEWLGWWTYVVLALGSSWFWVALIGPVLLGFLLFRVTGIPATEAQALRSRGDEYRRYQASTSRFVPWFPKPEPQS
jgi:steroid 5-alpha reductase family enzyme